MFNTLLKTNSYFQQNILLKRYYLTLGFSFHQHYSYST